MIVANRALPLVERGEDGVLREVTLKQGEALSRAMCEALPPGRLAQLLEQHHLSEIVDERIEARKLEDLAFRVEKLERTVAQLTVAQEKASTAKATSARKEG